MKKFKIFGAIAFLSVILGIATLVYGYSDQGPQWVVMLANGDAGGQNVTTKYIDMDLTGGVYITEQDINRFFSTQDTDGSGYWGSIAPPAGTRYLYRTMGAGTIKWWTSQGGTVIDALGGWHSNGYGAIGLVNVDATGTTPKVRLPRVAKDYHNFTGWSVAATQASYNWYNGAFRHFSGSNKGIQMDQWGWYYIDVGAFSTIKLLRPNFSPWQHTVVYDANGGWNAPASQLKTYGVQMFLSTGVPSRDCSRFLGWNTARDGSGTWYQPGDNYTPDQNGGTVTLYAQWDPWKHTVAYDANGGTGAPESQTKVYLQQMFLRSEIPTWEGHEFIEWNTMPDGSGTSYAPGQNYTPDQDGGVVTLYAQWKGVEHKKEYVLNIKGILNNEEVNSIKNMANINMKIGDKTLNGVDVSSINVPIEDLYEVLSVTANKGYVYKGVDVSEEFINYSTVQVKIVNLTFNFRSTHTVDLKAIVDGFKYDSIPEEVGTVDIAIDDKVVSTKVRDFKQEVEWGTKITVQNGITTPEYTLVSSTPISILVKGNSDINVEYNKRVTPLRSNYITHAAFGFLGEGNSGGGLSFALGNSSFRKNEGSKFVMDDSYSVKVPKGFYLKGFSSFSIEGILKDYPLGTEVTQINKSMYFTYNYYPTYYNIKYNLGGGTNNKENPTRYNILYGVTLKAPTRPGYVFEGWLDSNGNKVTGINEGCGAKFSDVSDLMSSLESRSTGDITLTASWRLINPILTAKDNMYRQDDMVTLDKIIKDNARAEDIVQGNISSSIKITKLVYSDGTVVDNPSSFNNSYIGKIQVTYFVKNSRGGTDTKTAFVYIIDDTLEGGTIDSVSAYIYSRFISKLELSDGTNAKDTLEEGSIWSKDTNYAQELEGSLSKDKDDFIASYKIKK